MEDFRQIHSLVYGEYFGFDQVRVSTEWHSDDISGVKCATEAYSWRDGRGIGPKFLAHIMENKDRCIDYMIEWVCGRPATIADFKACRTTLPKLHQLGITHGGLTRYDFLVTDTGLAVLHNFEIEKKTDDRAAMEAEMAGMEDAFKSDRGRRHHISQELHAEIGRINKRDDWVHPLIYERAEREGKITISGKEHKKMLLELRIKLGCNIAPSDDQDVEVLNLHTCENAKPTASLSARTARSNRDSPL
jgi:hypothetical protein